MHLLTQPTDHWLRRVADEEIYGTKCARLLELRSFPEFHDLVPPVFPMDAGLAKRFLLSCSSASQPSAAAFQHWLDREVPDLYVKVAETCGPLPWIVRSSGPEDDPYLLEAGVFVSLICENKSQFNKVISQVILSGFRQETAAYLRRAGRIPEPIPVFIQPVIEETKDSISPADEAPVLSLDLNTDLEQNLLELHKMAWPCTLICEWVLAGKQMVSATTITTLQDDSLSGDGWFGFGRASAQTIANGTQNSRTTWLPEISRPLLSGNRMRNVSKGDWKLVQVRPTARWGSEQMIAKLAPGEHDRLLQLGFSAIPFQELIVPVKSIPSGRFLASESLSWAWHTYLTLPESARHLIKAVFASTGSSAEHAGIMFRQQNIMVARVQKEAIPEGSVTVVVDCSRDTCYFSPQYCVPDIASQNCMAIVDAVPADAFLHLVPSDVKALEASTTRNLVLALAGSFPSDPRKFLRDHASIPEALHEVAHCTSLSVEQRMRILRQSLVGAYGTRIIHDRPSVPVLPSLLGLAAVFGRGLTASFCSSAIRSLPRQHPAWAYLVSRWKTERLLPHDGSLSAEAFEILLEYPALTSAELATELDAVLHGLVAAAHEEQVRAVLLLVRFSERVRALGLYSEDESSALWRRLLQAVKNAQAVATIQPLIRDDEMAAHHLVWWLEKAVSNPASISVAMNAYHQARQHGRALAAGAPGAVTEVLNAFAALKDKLSPLGAPPDSGLTPAFIDAYDTCGKRLLNSMTTDADPVAWKEYTSLLFSWIQFLRQLGASPVTMDVLEKWLQAQSQPPRKPEFTLENQHWTTWIHQAERDGTIDLPNIHQLQNVLHQLSLSLTPLPETSGLPVRVQNLLLLANTFRKRRNRLLRLESKKLEIERCMGIHKASFVFTPEGVSTEFYEPPAASAEGLARIQVFEGLLSRFNDWWHEQTFIYRKEHLAGTFGFHIWTKPNDRSADPAPSHCFAYQALTTMFDMAYDLSGISTHLGDLRNRFTDPLWGEVFAALVHYRTDLDDSDQHVALRSYPLAQFLLNMVLKPALEGWFLSEFKAGFEKLYGELTRFVSEFDSPKTAAEWSEFKTRLDLLSLLCAVQYPLEALNALRQEPMPGWGFDSLGRSLLRRRCVAGAIRQAAVQFNPAAPQKFHLFLLRHAPDVFLQTGNVLDVARFVSTCPSKYARASAFLIHRFSTQLPRPIVHKILQFMELVPLGQSEEEESLLRTEALVKPRYNILYPLGMRPADLAEASDVKIS